MKPEFVQRTMTRHRGATRDLVDDLVVVEAPMEIRLDGVPLAVIMRTPGDDAMLATGFALTEGIVLHPEELDDVVPIGDDDDARWELVLADGVEVDAERFRRNLYSTSSCGVCGKASIDAVRVAAAIPGKVEIGPGMLLTLPGRMRDHQVGFAATGAVHAAALFGTDGDLAASAEDVGRHNAVDKVIGRAAQVKWPVTGILMVSGRVSFEIVQKAAVAGIGTIAGISAPSTLAIELGRELEMTIIGFLRGDGFNVYAGSVD